MPDGRIAFVVKKPHSSNPLDWRPGLMAVQIMSVAADGSDLRLESATQDCRGPAFDTHSGRMVCSGEAPGPHRQSFLAPGAHNEVRLPDRILEVQGVYSQFCSTSGDGRRIVTAQGAGEWGPMRLVVSDLDGSNAREIFRSPEQAAVWASSWAQRADLIAFTVGSQFAPDDAVVDIWTMRSDGSNPANLTQGKFRNNAFPDLTADGKEIVFRSTRDGSKQIYLMNSDGTNVRPLTSGAAGVVATMPAISPLGDLIAFSSIGKIYLQPLKDGRPEGGSLLFQKDTSFHAHFSPDGKWIVFASEVGWLEDEGVLSGGGGPPPSGAIYVAPVDGKSGPIRLTHNKWSSGLPCWSAMPRP